MFQGWRASLQNLLARFDSLGRCSLCDMHTPERAMAKLICTWRELDQYSQVGRGEALIIAGGKWYACTDPKLEYDPNAEEQPLCDMHTPEK